MFGSSRIRGRVFITTITAIFIFGNCSVAVSQVKLHSHNDYEKAEPLFNAIRNQAYIIEADVYAVDGELYVAHHRNEVNKQRTLENMYLRPIDSLIKQNEGSVSASADYTFNLMIDFKSSYAEVMPILLAQLNKYENTFASDRNKHSVRIVISGNRGRPEEWLSSPSFIFYDGRPNEVYSVAQLERVAYISDSYYSYVKKSDSMNLEPLKPVIKKVHGQNKLVRFWGGPDNAEAWKASKEAGIDIINTDHIEECRKIVLSK